MSEEMPEKVRELFMTFKAAVEREKEAQSMYRHAAELSHDEELKGILIGFSIDEARHEKALVERYNRMRKEYHIQEE